jgi:hypothetical protein
MRREERRVERISRVRREDISTPVVNFNKSNIIEK